MYPIHSFYKLHTFTDQSIYHQIQSMASATANKHLKLPDTFISTDSAFPLRINAKNVNMRKCLAKCLIMNFENYITFLHFIFGGANTIKRNQTLEVSYDLHFCLRNSVRNAVDKTKQMRPTSISETRSPTCNRNFIFSIVF